MGLVTGSPMITGQVLLGGCDWKCGDQLRRRHADRQVGISRAMSASRQYPESLVARLLAVRRACRAVGELGPFGWARSTSL